MKGMLCFQCAVAVGVVIGGCAADETDGDVTVHESALTGCVPQPLQASLFLGDFGTGTCVTAGLGIFPSSQYFGLPNDAIQSVRLGRGARVAVFSDSNYGGSKRLITSNTDGLGHSISSLRVEYATDNCENLGFRAGNGTVAMYTDPNFGGDCVVRYAGELCPYLLYGGYGGYSNAALCIGLPNDSISSARIGTRTSANFCRDDGFAGLCDNMQNTSTTTEQAQPNFRFNTIGDNTVSSLRIVFP